MRNTKQILISDVVRWDFSKTVNSFLDKGWSVVPETLIVNLSNYTNVEFNTKPFETYMVILEKEIVD